MSKMMTRVAEVRVSGVSPYSSSRPHQEPKQEGETADAYERRTWRHKAHINDKGQPFIPPMAFKWGLTLASRMLGLQVPGRGKTTYTKFFESGVMVVDEVIIGADASAMEAENVFVNADGIRGSGKRVFRTFPKFSKWSGTVVFHVLAPEIDAKTFDKVLTQAGLFIGVGRFRPERGGYFGRFSIDKITWKEG